MLTRRIVLIFVTLVILEVNPSVSISCYQCNVTNPKCNERPFNVSSPGVAICEGLSCYKLERIAFDKYISAERGCWPRSVQHYHNCSTIIRNGVGNTNCTCPWNLCNVGFKMRVEYGSILLISLLACFVLLPSRASGRIY